MSKGKKDAAVQDAAATVAAKVRKSTKGVPRVTDGVIAMSETDRAAWLAKVPAEHRTDVEARLTEALKGGRKVKAVDFSTAFNGRSVEELTAAMGFLTSALALAAVSAETETEAEAELVAVQARLDALRTARVKVGTPAA